MLSVFPFTMHIFHVTMDVRNSTKQEGLKYYGESGNSIIRVTETTEDQRNSRKSFLDTLNMLKSSSTRY